MRCHIVIQQSDISLSFWFQDFIRKCLCDQTKRPTARDLLLHRVLFEVHSLKLLAAHCIVHTESKYILMIIMY